MHSFYYIDNRDSTGYTCTRKGGRKLTNTNDDDDDAIVTNVFEQNQPNYYPSAKGQDINKSSINQHGGMHDHSPVKGVVDDYQQYVRVVLLLNPRIMVRNINKHIHHRCSRNNSR